MIDSQIYDLLTVEELDIHAASVNTVISYFSISLHKSLIICVCTYFKNYRNNSILGSKFDGLTQQISIHACPVER